jgi:hypothetical protein
MELNLNEVLFTRQYDMESVLLGYYVSAMSGPGNVGYRLPSGASSYTRRMEL